MAMIEHYMYLFSRSRIVKEDGVAMIEHYMYLFSTGVVS